MNLTSEERGGGFDYFFRCAEREQIERGATLIASSPQAAEIYSCIKKSLAQLKYIKDSLLKLSKADVHSHLHLGGSQKKLLENYPNANINFPKTYDGLEGMIDFINGHLNKIMLTKSDVINFMEIVIESSIDDNIKLLEASLDVGLCRFFDDSIDDVILEVERIKEKYKSGR